jgi:hypothetical protein
MISRQGLFEKYLDLLGVEKSEPNFDLLKKNVKAHLIKVPFENISKLLYKNKELLTSLICQHFSMELKSIILVEPATQITHTFNFVSLLEN